MVGGFEEEFFEHEGEGRRESHALLVRTHPNGSLRDSRMTISTYSTDYTGTKVTGECDHVNKESNSNKSKSGGGFLSLLESQSLCDVELLAGNTMVYIPAHKVVLAAHSPFFRAIFAGASSDMIENARSCVRVENVDDGTLTVLLRAMYASDSIPWGASTDHICDYVERVIFAEVSMEEDSVPKVLEAATYLTVESVVDVCCQYLMARMYEENVVNICILSERCGCVELYDVAKGFLVENFGAVLRCVEGAESLCHMPKHVMLDVLNARSKVHGCVHYGADVLTAVMLWCREMSMVQQDAMCLLMDEMEQRVFYYDEYRMAVDALSKLQRGGEGIVSDECMELVWERCMKAPETPHSMTEVYGCGDWLQLESLSHCSQIVAAGGISDGWKSMRSTEVYCLETDRWIPGPDLPFECSFAHACRGANGHAYIAGKSPSLLQYTNNEHGWQTLSSSNTSMTPRVNSACVTLGNDVHVIGGLPTVGRDRHPVCLHECFRAATCTWETLAPMQTSRSSLDACCIFDRLWAVGGQSLRQTHDTVEWYDAARDSWCTSSSRMSTPRKYASVNSLCETSSQLVVIGGMNDKRMRLNSVEAFDPREGRWRVLQSLPRSVSSAASCVAPGNQIFHLGGRVDRLGIETNAMWVYSVRKDEWTACESMSTPRSSLAAVAI